jgi:hypothetical protein
MAFVDKTVKEMNKVTLNDAALAHVALSGIINEYFADLVKRDSKEEIDAAVLSMMQVVSNLDDVYSSTPLGESSVPEGAVIN